jgi:hypothetical protein
MLLMGCTRKVLAAVIDELAEFGYTATDADVAIQGIDQREAGIASNPVRPR